MQQGWHGGPKGAQRFLVGGETAIRDKLYAMKLGKQDYKNLIA